MSTAESAGPADGEPTEGRAVDPGAVGLVCGGLLVYLLNNAAAGVFVMNQPREVVLMWLIPDAAGVAVVWALTRHIPPGWAFLLVAVVLAAVAGRGALARRH